MPLTRRQVLAGGAAMACLGAAPPAPGGKPWNVLWISSDEHNVRWSGFEGHPVVRTPTLDRLASQSLRLRNTYVSAPSCAPTRQSWLTGLWPQEHGQLHNNLGFDPRNRCLPEVWAEAGYRTACFGKLHTWCDESEPGFAGFGQVMNADWTPKAFTGLRRELRLEHGFAGVARKVPEEQALWASMPQKSLSGLVHGDPHLCNDWVLVQTARAWLGRQTADTPFFLYTSLRLPHHPYTLLEDFYFRHAPQDLLQLPVARGQEAAPSAERSARLRGWGSLSAEQLALLHARYAGAIEQTDWLVGLLVDALDALGLAQNTILVYSSDHGDMAGDHGLWWKGVMFEGATRKPLLVRMPGVLPEGGVHQGMVNEVDLLPTLAGLCGLSSGRHSGHDLSEVLLSDSPGQPYACSFFDQRGQRAELAMCRDQRFKLMRHGTRVYDGRDLLFDLEEDPDETTDVAALHPKKVRELRRVLDRVEGGMRPRFAGTEPLTPPG